MSEHDFRAMRAAMVASQLRPNEVSDPVIVSALEAVARENFVPADRAVLAYVDVPIPLGEGRALNAPLATARLLAAAKPRADETMLIVGAATGYAAALAVRLGTMVTALEESPALLSQARANLVDPAVRFVEAPLASGWPEGQPYDIILIDGAIATLPSEIQSQLAIGGRLVCGLMEGGVTRLAHGIRSEGGFSMLPFADVEVVPLPGFEAPRVFSF